VGGWASQQALVCHKLEAEAGTVAHRGSVSQIVIHIKTIPYHVGIIRFCLVNAGRITFQIYIR